MLKYVYVGKSHRFNIKPGLQPYYKLGMDSPDPQKSRMYRFMQWFNSKEYKINLRQLRYYSTRSPACYIASFEDFLIIATVNPIELPLHLRGFGSWSWTEDYFTEILITDRIDYD